MRYSCDYLTKRTYNANKIKDSSIVSNVKSLIKKTRRERVENSRLEFDDDDEQPKEKATTNSTKNEQQDNCLRETIEQQVYLRDDNRKVCYCDKQRVQNNDLLAGWEGPAVLNHGSLVVFGCLEFTFSITDFGINYGGQAS